MASAPASSALDAVPRPELPAGATELAQALRGLVRERLAAVWVLSTEQRAGPGASPASAAVLVERQEPLSRSEPAQNAVAELALAPLAEVVRSAAVHAPAWPALAQLALA